MDKAQVADDLRGGAQYIRDHGHSMHCMVDADGRVCAMGGIRGYVGTLENVGQYKGGWAQRDADATEALARYLEAGGPPEKVTPYTSFDLLNWATAVVADWNDHKAASAREVVETMEKVAAHIEEQA